ncbi:hypothetical protein Tco_0825761, partial [Tanacetum coccineum]
VGLGKGSSFAYRSRGESVASVAKASQPNNATIVLASSDGLTPESNLARHCFSNSKRDLTGWTYNNTLRAKYNSQMAGMNAQIAKPNGKNIKDWESR